MVGCDDRQFGARTFQPLYPANDIAFVLNLGTGAPEFGGTARKEDVREWVYVPDIAPNAIPFI